MLAGATVGIIFDFYRTTRRWLRLGPVTTWVGDLAFSVVTLFVLLHFFLKANELDFRFYILWGSIAGLLIYLRLFSRFTTKVFLKLLEFIGFMGRVIKYCIGLPFRLIEILMRPPYAFLRWLGLLFFRIGEAFLTEPLMRLENKIHNLWKRIFPPRTNG